MKLKKENIMFNKKYLAIATLALVPAVSNAAMTITSTPQLGTVAGLTGVDDVSAGATTFVTGIPYVVNDYVTVTYSSALDEGFTPATGVITCSDTTDADKVDTGVFLGADAMTIQYNSTSADRTSVDYVVASFSSAAAAGLNTGADAGNAFAADGIGLSCEIGGAAFNGDDMIASAAAVTGAALSVSAKSTSSLTGNTKEETAANASANAFTVAVTPQFALSSAANAASAEVDVTASPLARGKFAQTNPVGATIAGGGTLLTAVLDMTTTASGGVSDAVSAATGHSATLTGDFSWMLDANGALKAGYTVVTNPAAVVTVTATTVSFPLTKAQVDAGTSFSVAITTDGATQIPAVSALTHSATIAYANTDGQAQTAMSLSTAVGSWALNGPTVTVYNVPFGANIGQFLWVSNSSTLEGEISATVTIDGTVLGPYELGTAAGNDNTPIAQVLSSAMAAAGETPMDGERGDVSVTVNANDNNITVYGGYKVVSDADRLNLPTSAQADVN
jgi:hypothetical protein